ncbi:MAG: hypothetical protein Kow006_17420 [Gammaproteobacteria bacterium]
MKEDYDLLGRMRELHLPEPIGWWPPAPGWWLLLLLTLSMGMGAWLVWRRRTALRRAAMNRLWQIRAAYREHRDGKLLLRELSVLLRRVALGRSARYEVAGLTGEAWLGYLDSAGGGTEFRHGEGRAFAVKPYSSGAVAAEEADRLLALVERWIRRAT